MEIFEFSTPSVYISRLSQLYVEAETDKRMCRGTFIIRIGEISEKIDESNYYLSMYEEDIRRRSPCADYLDFLDKFQKNLDGVISRLEGLAVHDENRLVDEAHDYAQKYRIKNDEISELIEKQKSSKPLLWIVLSFILTPILSVIINAFGIWLSKIMMEILPQLAYASSGFPLAR